MKKSATIVEFIVVCAIIFVFIGVASVYFTKALAGFREVVLKSQLADIRLSLKLYKVFHDEFPKDIRTLLSEEVNMMPYSGSVIKKKYIESVRSDKEGFPIDPFENRFKYCPDTGEVRPGTKGYENW